MEVAKDTEVEPYVEHVAPEMAEDWLRRNQENRSVRQRVVNLYAREMERGNWHLSNDAIAFDEDGTLINGQHRLEAVIQSGTVQRFLVVRGLDPEAFQWMDQPYKRTLAQALKLDGYANANNLAAMSRLLYWLEMRQSFKKRVSTPEGVKFVKHHMPSIMNTVRHTRQNEDRMTGLWRPSVANTIHFCLATWDSDVAMRFFRPVATGIGLEEETDPRYQLRARLEDEARRATERVGRHLEMAWTIKAARYFLTGDWRDRLVWKTNEGYPVLPFSPTYEPYHTEEFWWDDELIEKVEENLA